MQTGWPLALEKLETKCAWTEFLYWKLYLSKNIWGVLEHSTGNVFQKFNIVFENTGFCKPRL